MPAPQNFRTAFNGFNREDVVRYLEYLNAKHTAQVNQLTSEADFLRSKLDAVQPAPDQEETIAALEQERDDLRAQLEELQERCSALEQQLAETPEQAASETPNCTSEELEAYRRAERTERIARERAELVYHQVNGVLADASAKVDNAAGEIGAMADRVLVQLRELQSAVGSSKQAFQDAASTLYAIRPDNN